jgi:signal transduction histidine kinase
MAESGFVKNFEVILTRADGATIFGLESATLIRDKDGGIYSIHAMVKDITGRIHDEQARWKMNLQLAEANQKLKESQALIIRREKLASIGQLAAGMAHEINNPLGFMKSNSSALGHFVKRIEAFLGSMRDGEKQSLADARAAYDIDYILEGLGKILEDLDEGFRRISEIVQNLRAFSRIDAGDALAQFDVNAGIQKTMIVAQNELKYSADVSLKLETLPLVECNEGEILQVFLNIVVNAAQAIKAEGRAEKGKIEIRTGTQGDMVWIEVGDDGPGISREDQQKIFDPFFTTKPVGQGTGLGLSISYDIIEYTHGGSLTVRSEVGKGACFRIELPVAHKTRER